MKPEDYIAAFDEVREHIFGFGLGRDNPHKTDMATAQLWINDGVSLTLATLVFTEQMNWMHEKFVRYGNGKDRSYLPAALKVFDENIETALNKQKNGGHFDNFETEILRWRSRCKSWQKNPNSWIENSWGPKPNEAGNRVPGEVLKWLNEEHMRKEMREAR